MVGKLMNMFFGCWHSKFSFPITLRGEAKRNRPAAMLTGTYVVCLDCGKEFAYDWQEMRVLNESEQNERRVASFAAKEAA